MSMMAGFRQVSPGVLARLRADPDRIQDAIHFGEDDEPQGAAPGVALEQMLGMMPEPMRSMMQAQLEKALAPRPPNALAENGVTASELPSPLDIEKAWHGLHFLLCRDGGLTSDPLSEVVMGGEELGDDLGYGPARVLEPARVASLATALEALPETELEKRFDPPAMDDLYPNIWASAGAEELEWLLETFRGVRDYYVEARRRGFGMMLYLT